MDTDRNLLFGVLALQADLIDHGQFLEACTLWAARKHMSLADILLERGWIQSIDKEHVDYLLERKLKKHAGDARASMAAVPSDVKRSLAAVADEDIQRSIAGAERILGLSADQLSNRAPTDPRWCPITEDGSPLPIDAYPTVITLRTGQPVTNVVVGVDRPDGSLTWITINSQPLFQADGKTLAGVVASFEDITERKQIEEELRWKTAQLERLNEEQLRRR